jgi:hypothetical protein
MARASAQTLLILDRYARLMGLDPLAFNGGYSAVRVPPCGDIWQQYDWQDNAKVSREQLAMKLAEAEQDIADMLGYWPAPVWIQDERLAYPGPQRTDLYAFGYDARGRMKGVTLKWGYLMYGGIQATELIEADVAYTSHDYDNDGFDEMARFSITLNAAMAAVLDECEVAAYYKVYDVTDAVNCRTDPASSGADPAWRIHDLRISLSGTTLIVYIPTWCLFRPQLHEGTINESINADQPASYVDEITFYRIYNDPSTQVQFMWGDDMTCESEATCAWGTQDGCMRIKDPRTGRIVPSAGTYSATTGLYTEADWSQDREPDVIRAWYRAGYRPEQDRGCELLDPWMAENIKILATARLELPLCDDCSQAGVIAERWREELASVSATSWQTTGLDLGNPFGPRYGEAYVYKRLMQRTRKRGKAVIF